MKKFLSLLLMVVFLVCAMNVAALAEKPIKIIVGGEKIESDVAPVAVNGRTLVPLRAIFEALDAEVQWDGDTKTVTATKDDRIVKLTLDDDVMYVNSESVVLDVPATAVSGRTMVPVRAVSEAMDCEVEWLDKARTVRVKTDNWVISDMESCEVQIFGDDSQEKYYYWTECTYGPYGLEKVDEYYNVNTYEKDNHESFEYKYDENGLEIPDNSDGRYEYDDYGRVISENDGVSKITYKYDDYDRLIKETQDSGGIKQNITYNYSKDGKLESKVNKYEYLLVASNTWNEKLYETRYEYDGNGNLLNEREYENGVKTSRTRYNYDEKGSLEKKRVYVDEKLVSTDYYEYENEICLITTEPENGSKYSYIDCRTIPNWYSREIMLHYDSIDKMSFDNKGNITELSVSRDNEKLTYKWAYDENYNMIHYEDQDGSYIKCEYIKVRF